MFKQKFSNNLADIVAKYNTLCSLEEKENKELLLINKDEEYIINYFKSYNIDYAIYNDVFATFLNLLSKSNELNLLYLNKVYKKILNQTGSKRVLQEIKQHILFNDKYNIDLLNNKLNEYGIDEATKNALFATINIINTNNFYINNITEDIIKKDTIMEHNRLKSKYKAYIDTHHKQTR